MAEALEAIESQVLGWAASFGMAYQVGLGLGQVFINPLHQKGHEAGSEVLFALSNPAWAILISLVDKYW